VAIRARVLALDLGKRRIGLAISDGLGIMAHGLETLERTRIREDLDRLAQIAYEREAQLLLIGNPLHMGGEESKGSHTAREFGRRLSAKTGIPVEFWDERLTSVEANEILAARGVSAQRRKGAVDRIAAILLLESYLQAHPVDT
jgi:putative Holliday junction resolvase